MATLYLQLSSFVWQQVCARCVSDFSIHNQSHVINYDLNLDHIFKPAVEISSLCRRCNLFNPHCFSCQTYIFTDYSNLIYRLVSNIRKVIRMTFKVCVFNSHKKKKTFSALIERKAEFVQQARSIIEDQRKSSMRPLLPA